MNKEEKIMARLQEHYNYLIKKGHEVVALMLQGSQNYDLDIYTEEYQSDIDSKAIILPSFEDFVQNRSPFSYTYILDNNEHIDTKDIRIMCEMLKKENISYIELLYTKFMIINPEYEDIVKLLIENRDQIVNINKNQFLRCISGMAMEKRKALTHPYPTIIDKINKYGYDPKQLHHLARLEEFITRYVNGVSLEDCYKSKNREYLLALKLGKYVESNKIIPVEEAIKMANRIDNNINFIKNQYCIEEDTKIDEYGISVLNKIKYELLKKKFKKDLKNT